MRIAVNHLTRMTAGHICVAGVDLDTGRHVRPVLAWGHLTPAFLARHQGPFDMARIVELGAPVSRPKKPHVEDCLFDPAKTTFQELLDADAFWAILCRTSKQKLADIFGQELRRAGRSSAGTDLGQGTASLGCLAPARRPCLSFQEQAPYRPRIRIQIDDGQFNVWVSVTDLRLYQADHVTPDRTIVEGVARRLRGRGAVILSVGLTREFASQEEPKPIHWLQVNNIHLEADPTRQLG